MEFCWEACAKVQEEALSTVFLGYRQVSANLDKHSDMANTNADQPPSGQEPTIHGSTMGSAAPHIVWESEKKAVDQPDTLETIYTNQTRDDKEVQRARSVEALGIPDWQAKEKRIVRILDMTMLPQLWILYMFNFLNRTNIAFVLPYDQAGAMY